MSTISTKQDCGYARTAQDLERKYSFGKSFSETLGLVNDTRDKVSSVESGLKDEIEDLETTLKRDAEQIVMQAKKELTTSINGVADNVTDLSDELTASINEVTDNVTNLSNELTSSINSVADDVTELSSEVELKLDAEAVTIVVEKEIAKGVDRVETKTGYTFDADGLDISKSGEAISNSLTHEGMYVKKSGDDILVADKDGVLATDLHAKTYLVIGEGEGRSRFEDYGINRTACFWVGG